MNVVDIFPEKLEAYIKYFVRFPKSLIKQGINVTRDKCRVKLTIAHCEAIFTFDTPDQPQKKVTVEFINNQKPDNNKLENARPLCDWNIMNFFKTNLSKDNTSIASDPMSILKLPQAILDQYIIEPLGEYKQGVVFTHKIDGKEIYIYSYSHTQSWIRFQMYSGKRPGVLDSRTNRFMSYEYIDDPKLKYSLKCRDRSYGFTDMEETRFSNMKNFKKYAESKILLGEL